MDGRAGDTEPVAGKQGGFALPALDLGQVGSAVGAVFDGALATADGIARSAGNAVGDAAANASGALMGLVNTKSEELAEKASDQNEDAAEFAISFLCEVLRLQGVQIDREHFLTVELRKKDVPEEAIALAVRERPASADISASVLDAIAEESISFETVKSSAMSFAAGLPGGFAMLGTIPADVTQYYVHAFRVMQKLAYLYGWSSFLDDCKETDDETLAILASFLGVMLGVGGASKALACFAAQVVRPAVERNVARAALTKFAWYMPLKKTLRLIGVNLTKQSVGKAASKVVPVVGGIISGGLTFVSLNAESHRLKDHLKNLPPARAVCEIVIEE